MEDKKIILIIEDESALREVLLQKISAVGFDVELAKNGEEGLKKIEEEKPDLILLDILMPRMDGITTMKKVREKYGKEIPIIILTNLSPDDQIMSDIVKEEPAFYLLKTDYKIEDVIKKIKSTLGIQ